MSSALKGNARVVESKLEDGQCGFQPDRSTTNQTSTLRQIFEKSWEYARDVFACFVDLEKAHDQITRDKLWRVLQEYGIDVHLLMMMRDDHYIRPTLLSA